MGPEQAQRRLDLFLVTAGAGPSRAAIQRAIKAETAFVNGCVARASQILAPGDEVVFITPPVLEAPLEPEAMPLCIVYEDQDLLVVDKPRGLVVHPAPGNARGTLVNALLSHCRDLSGIGGVIRPGIVHRLDKDTTGLLVIAKNDEAHLGLCAQLQERVMSRQYLALVHGAMPAPVGRLSMPIGRHPTDRKKMAVSAKGRPAATNYRVLEILGRYALLLLRLDTGRTHQIRVHLSAVGHPVVGDRTYGRRHEDLGLTGQALHAVRLSFVHPRTGESLVFQADPPVDFLAALGMARQEAGFAPNAPIDFAEP